MPKNSIMKKSLLLLSALVCFFGQSAFADITLSASPMSQGPFNPGDTFNVTFSLSVTGDPGDPVDVAGFNLLIETLSANSGYFSIMAATPTGPFTAPAGAGNYPDNITNANSNHSGFAQNLESQGFTTTAMNAVPTPIMDLSIVTLSIVINAGTPGGTYNFNSTESSTSSFRGSLVNDSNGTPFSVDNPAVFSITVIPEPATWSLFALGGLAAVGLNRLRARRRN